MDVRVAGIVIEDDQILLLNQGTGAGRSCSLPGGKVEEGESFGGALIREMREETGIDAAHVGTTVCNIGPELYQMTRREELIAHPARSRRSSAARPDAPGRARVWVPTTCVTWADVLRGAVASSAGGSRSWPLRTCDDLRLVGLKLIFLTVSSAMSLLRLSRREQ
ncbi:MAG TPA: NUDIX hydrolase [Trebonia sp.]|nr:NUDIX hydrolase [Trebonia sp.]